MNLGDRNAILEVIAQYSYTYDTRDADAWSELFTEEAIWELYYSGEENPAIKLKSRKEIKAWAQDRLAGREGTMNSRHHQTGTIFESLSEKTARTRTMILVTHQKLNDPTPVLSLSGEYQDFWEKTSSGWKFAKRKLLSDKIMPSA